MGDLQTVRYQLLVDLSPFPLDHKSYINILISSSFHQNAYISYLKFLRLFEYESIQGLGINGPLGVGHKIPVH